MIILLTHVLILGILSDETWIEIETELLKFKRLSDMPKTVSDEEDGIPHIGHSQSDLFLHKQSVSDKMVADCVESLIGTYVYVSMINKIVYYISLITICFYFRNVELK